MGFFVREADIVQERDILLETLNNNRAKKKDRRRYDWVYLQNPYGKARAWFVICDITHEIVGGTAVFPRLMFVGGKDILCWTCGDFSINKKFRTLGPAAKLRKAATFHVNDGDIPFLYAHPNNQMKPVHLMAGHTVLGEMVQYVLQIKPSQSSPGHIEKYWINSKLNTTTMKRLYMKWLDIVFSPTSFQSGFLQGKGSFASIIHKDFPGEVNFQELFDRIKSHYAVVGVRSAEYLKWRFWENPTIDAFMLLLFKAQETVGYAICWRDGHTLKIVDFFCLPETEVMTQLLQHLGTVAQQTHVARISFTVLESHPVIPTLKKSGYAVMPNRTSVMVHVNEKMPDGELLKQKDRWLMTVGDRDV